MLSLLYCSAVLLVCEWRVLLVVAAGRFLLLSLTWLRHFAYFFFFAVVLWPEQRGRIHLSGPEMNFIFCSLSCVVGCKHTLRHFTRALPLTPRPKLYLTAQLWSVSVPSWDEPTSLSADSLTVRWSPADIAVFYFFWISEKVKWFSLSKT